KAHERVPQEALASGSHERLAGVVPGQLPGLGNLGRGAHALSPALAGTQTSIADGSTSISSFLTFSRSPPSSSYRTLRSNVTLAVFAFVTRTNGEVLEAPTAVRAMVRVQSSRSSAVTTPS